MGNIQRVQKALKKAWNDEQYSEQFRNSKCAYKHFDHTIKHVQKAANRLQEMVEEADHQYHPSFDEKEIKKYVADVIISAVRLANVSPLDIFDVEEAVLARLKDKMKLAVEPESDGEEKRLNEKINILKKTLRDHVMVWNDPSDRNYRICNICDTHEFNQHKASCPLS